jgi:uncharacterized protein
LKECNRAFNNDNESYYSVPDKRRDIVDFLEIGDTTILDRVIATDRMEARVSFMSKWDSNESANKMKRHVDEYMEKKLGGKYNFRLTGIAALFLKMERNLFYSQVFSFVFSYITIFIMMFFICRTFFLTFIAMLPNIFPIFIVLGFMGLKGIAFDVVTIMIGGITMGIAVDDTIHYMVWFRRNVAAGMNHEEAVRKTFRDVGKPAFIISVALCLGFLVLMLGSMGPTVTFGALTALTMAIAPFGDYLMLPSLIMVFKPKVKGRTDIIEDELFTE